MYYLSGANLIMRTFPVGGDVTTAEQSAQRDVMLDFNAGFKDGGRGP